MTRLYGRAKSNERVIDYVPDLRFKRQSVISTISLNGEMAPMIFNGTLTGDLFLEYVKKILCPILKQGDIVIMDNCTSHKVSGVEEAIINVGATIKYLPPYSPDLNPIEQMWSKIKAYLRKVKASTIQSLEKALLEAFTLVTKDDIKGWFTHSGYMQQ